MIAVRYEPEALEELEEAAAWYERARAGVGHRFAARVDEAIDRIAEAPMSFPLLLRVDAELIVRRARLDRFPYAVVFLPLVTDIRILAVAHLRRRPGYWRERVPVPPGA